METKDILLELRQKMELSQEELAERVFVTRQASYFTESSLVDAMMNLHMPKTSSARVPKSSV